MEFRLKDKLLKLILNMGNIVQAVERQIVALAVEGASPSVPTKGFSLTG